MIGSKQVNADGYYFLMLMWVAGGDDCLLMLIFAVSIILGRHMILQCGQ